MRAGAPTRYADVAIELGRLEGIVVPDLFWHEVRSVLLVGERKGRIEVGTMDDHMKDIRQLSVTTNAHQADGAVSTLSRKHDLSGCDAAYLETAVRRGAKLSTLDKKLADAAIDEGVSSEQLELERPSQSDK